MEHTTSDDDKVARYRNSLNRNENSHNNNLPKSSTSKATIIDSLKSCVGSKQSDMEGNSNMSTASIEILSDLQNYMQQNRNHADPWLHQLLEMMHNFIEVEKKSYMSNEEIGYKSKKKTGYTFNLPKYKPKKKDDEVKRPPNTAFVVNIDSNARKSVAHISTQTELLRDYAKKCVVATKPTQTSIRIYKHKGVQVVPPPLQPAADHHLVLEDADNNNNCLPINCGGMNMDMGNHHQAGMSTTSDDWQQYGMLQHRHMSSHTDNEVCWVLENRQKVYGTKFKNVAATTPIPTSNTFNEDNEIVEFNKKAQFTMSQSSRFNNGRGFESSGRFMSENREQFVNSRSSSRGGHFVNKNSSERFIQRSNTEQQTMNARAGPFIDDDIHEKMINASTGRFIDRYTNGQVMDVSSGRFIDNGVPISSSGPADDFTDDYIPQRQLQANQKLLATQDEPPQLTITEDVVEQNKKDGRSSRSRFFKLKFLRRKSANTA